MTIEERLAELRVRFGSGDPQNREKVAWGEYWMLLGTATQLAGLLREARGWCAVDSELVDRIDAMLDGEGGGDAKE